jgi:hypothetical protein
MRSLASRTRFGRSRGIGAACSGTLVIEPALDLLEPLLAPVGRRQLRRQFIAATITEALILLGVDLTRALDDFPREPLKSTVASQLAFVERDLAAAGREGVGR